MSHKTEILTAAGTLTCALAIGFVMQSGEAAKQRYGGDQLASATTVPTIGTTVDPLRIADASRSNPDDPQLSVNGIRLTSAGVGGNSNEGDDTDQISVSLLEQSQAGPEKAEFTVRSNCPINATAETRAGAMVDFEITAQCYAEQTVTISHKGMSFSEALGADGGLKVLVPALEKNAELKVTFENGRHAVASSLVSTIALYNRVVVEAHSNAGVQIHAREFGADYGQQGHVWAEAPRNPDSVSTGVGGFLTLLGDPALGGRELAQIYTYPVTLSGANSTVDLTVETEVTAENCGQTIEASTTRIIKGGDAETKRLSIDVPGCETIGDFLVLKNPLEELKLARN